MDPKLIRRVPRPRRKRQQMRRFWTRSEKMSLAALVIAALAALLSLGAPWVYHWADKPEVAMEVAGGGVVWARYMGECNTGGTPLTAVLREGQPTCPKGTLRDDNYMLSIPLSLHNTGHRGGVVSDLSLVLKTPHQEYTFEPYQLEQKTADGLGVHGHLPDPIVVGPEQSKELLVGFRSALRSADRLVFSPEDRGESVLVFEAVVDGTEVKREFSFEFVGYVKTTGFVAWREGT